MQVKKLCSFYPWLILSLIVGLVFYSEHIYLKLHLGKTYSPLTLNDQSPSFAVDETIFYATKTRAILNHHWFLGDPQIWEYQYKASPHLGEWLPAVILAGLSRLGGSLANGFMMADFVGPAVNFLVISLWLFYQTKQKAWAMVGGLTMMVLTYYLKYLPFVPSMIKIVIAGLTQGSFSPFIRSFHPQLTFPVLMLFLISAWKQRWWLSGILAGVLAYCHFFYFSFAVVFLAITSLQA
ncbi:MAG: hypothetical protein Q8O59_03935, partial [bacterium]|nr:hypothetical protein [bacterium]